jgi:hypothetical protein
MTFSNIVEEIYGLSPEEQQELRDILDREIVEARRREILEHYEETRSEEQLGQLREAGSAKELLAKVKANGKDE